MTKSYQLTRHPVGTLREMWAISWPLMVGLISSTLMLFIDRILLAWYSPEALTAGANAGMAYYMLLIVPMGICAISEVLVGRIHGEGNHGDAGNAVWQMVRFAVIIAPLMWAAGLWLPPLIFYGTGNELLEMEYFQPLMFFSPFVCGAVALSGFFIGIGRVRIVTYCTLAANVVNILCAYLLIFGCGSLPPMGVKGASIAIGLAELFQMLLLLFFFLKKECRATFGTNRWRHGSQSLWEGLRIGAPAALGHGVEVLAHYLFFRIVMLAGGDSMTIVAMIQSFYILVSFVIDAQSKAVSTIVANLIGAREYGLIGRVCAAACKLHTLFSLLFLGTWLLLPNALLGLFFLSGEGASASYTDPAFLETAYRAALWMCLFFLFDGFGWILIGQLTAAGDTKFILYISSVVNWLTYLLPTYILIGVGHGGGDVAWMVITAYSVINFGLYFWRYSSRYWLKSLATPA